MITAPHSIIKTRTLVRAECLITQLIFEHSLRIRVKAETDPNAPPTSTPATPATLTPDQASINESSSPQDESSISSHVVDASTTDVNTLHSRDETLRASSSSVKSSASSKGKSKSKSTKEDDKASKQTDKDGHSSADNLVGKINNLVTTDLNNIVDSRDFMMVLVYLPLQITLCITFLYFVLGWRYVYQRQMPVPNILTLLVRLWGWHPSFSCRPFRDTLPNACKMSNPFD